MRRLTSGLTVLLVATICTLLAPAVSHAAPSIAAARAQARQLQSEVDSLNSQMEIVVERYDAAAQRLTALQSSITANEAQLARARYSLQVAHQQLAAQLVDMYKQPVTQYLDVALAARSFNDLATRITLYDKIGEQTAQTVEQITALKAAIARRHAHLVVQRKQAQQLVDQIASQKAQIESSLQHRRRLLESAKAQVRRLIVQMQRAKAAAAARAAAAAAAARKAARSSGGGGVAYHGGAGSAADIAIAQRYLGVPYVWGGASPSGFDCSGLVMYVFAQLGVSLPHNAAMQFALCTPVPRADLQPGDLVFYGYSPGSIHHVGIYVGNGTMIDAPCTGEVVRYDSLFSDFYSGGRV